MNKKFLKESEEKLKKEKESIELELKKFAKEDKELKGDWDTRYPKFSKTGASGSQSLEESADEVEEYGNLLPIEYNLELRLQNVNSALEKIKKGEYGKCEKCGRNISEKRLKVYPAAKTCVECSKK